jgi:O-antigen/teichoic acid export membrane protein
MENSEAKDSYSHVLKYTGIFGGVQGLNIVIGLVRNKLIALLLGPSGMGLASLFNSSINFVSQATNLGISFSAVKNISEVFDKGDEKRLLHIINMVRGWAIITALLGILVCMVAGPLLSDYTFSWGNHTLHYVLLAPAVGLIAITGGETAILKGTHTNSLYAVGDCNRDKRGAGGKCVVAYLGKSVVHIHVFEIRASRKSACRYNL